MLYATAVKLSCLCVSAVNDSVIVTTKQTQLDSRFTVFPCSDVAVHSTNIIMIAWSDRIVIVDVNAAALMICLYLYLYATILWYRTLGFDMFIGHA